MTKKILLGFVLSSLLVMVSALVVDSHWQSQWADNTLAEDRVYNIAAGRSQRAILSDLSTMGLIPESIWFQRWINFKGIDSVQSGEYQLNAGESAEQIWSRLAIGDVKRYQITIIEGMSIREIMVLLQSQDTLIDDITGGSPTELAQQLNIDTASAEGWLAPSTYYYHRGDSVLSVLRRAKSLMNQWLSDAWENRSDRAAVTTAYEALILASIIEKETGVAAERPEISAVFTSRLNLGMRLQTDPTVIYGMGDRFDGDIRRRDLREATPWNTYVIRGLPPTPIASPSREAVIAAVNPGDGDYLYFVAKGDGSHYFSRTLEEHNKAVREYQLKGR
ncbi:endolytic transglycosylase MltG [uncultured Umboniibacter sp.]|uniref:endolytic transglycosylase MltG n=1 Tax=uncultured Umboniibacter sp. TaxID=1798917 RepID=UPI00261EF37D|nr:endolytic transglycosylase MltG [uncultured Umboniibacter sp.]